jgi:apolipoprotein D and lipocalin family protein
MLNCSCSKSQPLETVSYVDPERYAGLWYEIASFPQSFQKGCFCTTARYTKTDKGYLIVENRCRKDSLSGKEVSIKGKAFIEPNTGNSKLKVQFFWPFKGKYWIIGLAEDYSWAVVGHPNRKYCWILSRTPSLDEKIYKTIIDQLRQQEFEINRLQVTRHC